MGIITGSYVPCQFLKTGSSSDNFSDEKLQGDQQGKSWVFILLKKTEFVTGSPHLKHLGLICRILHARHSITKVVNIRSRNAYVFINRHSARRKIPKVPYKIISNSNGIFDNFSFQKPHGSDNYS